MEVSSSLLVVDNAVAAGDVTFRIGTFSPCVEEETLVVAADDGDAIVAVVFAPEP